MLQQQNMLRRQNLIRNGNPMNSRFVTRPPTPMYSGAPRNSFHSYQSRPYFNYQVPRFGQNASPYTRQSPSRLRMLLANNHPAHYGPVYRHMPVYRPEK